MTDKRELILARLYDVLKELADANAAFAFRNQINVPENKLPAIQLFDADETPDESAYGRGRPARGPVLVGMTPEIYVVLGGDAKEVGTAVNVWRARIIKAVLTDASLVEMCVNGDVRYEGCATALAKGRDMTGECGVAFTFNYVLKPGEL
jgi:hypothetical protein